MEKMKVEFIAQALLVQWRKEKAADTEHNRVVSLPAYLEYNYKERYVALCLRCGVEPIGYGKWLLKPITWLTE